MKKFFEKIHDILYDSVDYIIMIGIVGVVIFIIGWRLDLLFANGDKNIVSTDMVIEEAIDPIEEKEDEIKETEEILNVSIPSGSTSYSIATILESNGLISNKDDFINKCEELELSNKLKAGNYEVESGSSLETILAILTK